MQLRVNVSIFISNAYLLRVMNCITVHIRLSLICADAQLWESIVRMRFSSTIHQ